ncbi:MAG: hypothetical protein ACTHU0_28750 [Kofleriaceae bacterium]
MNDHECLGPTTDRIVAEVQAGNPAIVDLAARFTNTDELAAWFRSLPQRDDDGSPDEGPKVIACRPPQRLQLDSLSPNCFERAARFVGAADLIEPERVYRLATASTPNGLHTFPLRDGEPVILDPTTARNALLDEPISTRRLRIQRLVGLDERKGLRFDLANARRAKELGHPTWVDGRPIDDAIANYEKALARYQAILSELDALEASQDAELPDTSVRNSGGSVVLTPIQAIDWIANLAMARADRVSGGIRRIENGHRAMRGVLVLRPICIADVRDVALVLALAEREARLHGLGGLKVVHATARAVDALDQLAADRATTPTRNNPFASLALSALANKDLQQLVGGLARVVGRVAGGIGFEAAKVKLASVGVSPPVIAAVEKELNREGLSLGPLAKPSPIVGSLDAMMPQALAGRWLAQKLTL